MSMVITINGPDNVGKSTLCRGLNSILNSDIPLPAHLTSFDDRWPHGDHCKNRRWRLSEVELDELFDVMVTSYINRYKSVRLVEHKVFDRGAEDILNGFKSICCLRGSKQAWDMRRQYGVFKKLLDAEFKVLLLFSDSVADNLRKMLDPEACNQDYEIYANALVSGYFVDIDKYDLVVYRGDKDPSEVLMEVISCIGVTDGDG